MLVNRPNAKSKPYRDDYALHDTATEVRRLRQQGVSVLGVFVGEETELMAEQKIFGKDFACARYPQLFPYGGKLFKKKNRRINERNAPGGK